MCPSRLDTGKAFKENFATGRHDRRRMPFRDALTICEGKSVGV